MPHHLGGGESKKSTFGMTLKGLSYSWGINLVLTLQVFGHKVRVKPAYLRACGYEGYQDIRSNPRLAPDGAVSGMGGLLRAQSQNLYLVVAVCHSFLTMCGEGFPKILTIPRPPGSSLEPPICLAVTPLVEEDEGAWTGGPRAPDRMSDQVRHEPFGPWPHARAPMSTTPCGGTEKSLMGPNLRHMVSSPSGQDFLCRVL